MNKPIPIGDKVMGVSFMHITKLQYASPSSKQGGGRVGESWAERVWEGGEGGGERGGGGEGEEHATLATAPLTHTCMPILAWFMFVCFLYVLLVNCQDRWSITDVSRTAVQRFV